MKIGKLESYEFVWDFMPQDWGTVDLVRDVEEYCREAEYVHDCDGGGDFVHWYVVGAEGVFRFFRVFHSYGWRNWDSDDRNLYNEFECSEVQREDVTAEILHLV